jgi:nickel/cobalt transporter (NiCoT) family protein
MTQVAVASPPTRERVGFHGREWLRLGGMYATVAAVMAVGWSLFFAYQHQYGASYAAAGGLAFSFGLRHAFDADHISAIDDTTRYLMQRGKRPMGVGFFFSLGHSTVVVGLALAIAVAAQNVQRHLPGLENVGGVVGSLVSGTFLMAIALLDFFILRGIVDVWRKTKSGRYDQQQLDDLMTQRGFINRIMGSRWRRFISDSWQMYPVGVLFGLGFDTATEVGLLAITAAAATGHTGGGGHSLPFGAIIALPLLFTAGMSLMDTTDGVVMAKAYGWAFKNPLRKVYYNMATVSLGIFVAAGVGGVEFLQVISTHLSLNGSFWDWLNGLDFEILGYYIVGAFILLWIGSILYYKVSGIEQRYADRLTVDPFAVAGGADLDGAPPTTPRVE